MKLESSKLNVAWNALCKVNSKELIQVHSYKGARIPGRELGFTFRFSLCFVEGCILNIAQSSFANYMLCQSAKIMKLLLLSLLFLVRLV